MSISLETDVDTIDPNTTNIKRIPPSRFRNIDVSKTKSYQEALRFERKLQQVLRPLTEQIMKSNGDISMIRYTFFDGVYDLFYATVQNVYTISVNYVNDAHNQIPRLSDNDFAQIKKIASYATGIYFAKFDKYFRREDTIEQSNHFFLVEDMITKMIKQNMDADTSVNTVIQPKRVNLQSLSIEKQIDNLITSVVFMTLNIAAIQKTRQLLNLTNKDQIVALADTETKKRAAKFATDVIGSLSQFGLHLYLQKGFNILRDLFVGKAKPETPETRGAIINKTPQATSFLIWITEMDDKVCLQYCAPLDGQKFNANDTNHPIPIISTHPNCRCKLFSMDENGNLLADVTFADWNL